MVRLTRPLAVYNKTTTTSHAESSTPVAYSMIVTLRFKVFKWQSSSINDFFYTYIYIWCIMTYANISSGECEREGVCRSGGGGRGAFVSSYLNCFEIVIF